jgi:hypothetical protein
MFSLLSAYHFFHFVTLLYLKLNREFFLVLNAQSGSWAPSILFTSESTLKFYPLGKGGTVRELARVRRFLTVYYADTAAVLSIQSGAMWVQ